MGENSCLLQFSFHWCLILCYSDEVFRSFASKQILKTRLSSIYSAKFQTFLLEASSWKTPSFPYQRKKTLKNSILVFTFWFLLQSFGWVSWRKKVANWAYFAVQKSFGSFQYLILAPGSSTFMHFDHFDQKALTHEVLVFCTTVIVYRPVVLPRNFWKMIELCWRLFLPFPSPVYWIYFQSEIRSCERLMEKPR